MNDLELIEIQKQILTLIKAKDDKLGKLESELKQKINGLNDGIDGIKENIATHIKEVDSKLENRLKKEIEDLNQNIEKQKTIFNDTINNQDKVKFEDIENLQKELTSKIESVKKDIPFINYEKILTDNMSEISRQVNFYYDEKINNLVKELFKSIPLPKDGKTPTNKQISELFNSFMSENISKLRGLDGASGVNGANGIDGVGIANIEYKKEDLIFTLSDGKEYKFPIKMTKKMFGGSFTIQSKAEKTALLDGDYLAFSRGNDTFKILKENLGFSGGDGTWGSITGDIINQTDLQASLVLKQDILTEGAFTDGDKTKLNHITLTQNIDLDSQIELSNRIESIYKDTNEPTGFIREYRETMGIMELCVGSPPGFTNKKIIRIDHNGFTTVLDSLTFYDGSLANDREFAIHPLIYTPNVDVVIEENGGLLNRPDTRDITINGGTYYSCYIEGVKRNITTTQKVTFPNQSGLQFVYHDIDGNLQLAQTFAFDYFEDRPITATVYGNATTQDLVNFGDERHGIQMDGFTHRYLHFTEGTRYIEGMSINGLTNSGTTYTNISSGKAYDEDIYILADSQTNAPHLWLEWDGIKNVWRIEDDGINIAYAPIGIAQYNVSVNGEYGLADVTGNDCMIVFFVLTNNREYPYVKILGQDVYTSVNVARENVANAINDLVISGLPSPEFLPIGAVIINADGELNLLSDGSEYLDLRTAKISGVGTASIPVTNHQDLTGRDTANTHPSSAISYDNTTSGLTATNSQSAIDELKDGLNDKVNLNGGVIDGDLTFTDNTKGVVLIDELGDNWRLTINSSGSITTTKL